jgi:hypothetical protein
MSFELPDPMAKFIDEIVDSFVVWDLLIGFSRRPEVVASAETFGSLLGRPVEDVSAALTRLAEKGLVKTSLSDTQEILFEFDRATPLRDILQEFANFNDAQENRLKILSRLLHRGVFQ